MGACTRDCNLINPCPRLCAPVDNGHRSIVLPSFCRLRCKVSKKARRTSSISVLAVYRPSDRSPGYIQPACLASAAMNFTRTHARSHRVAPPRHSRRGRRRRRLRARRRHRGRRVGFINCDRTYVGAWCGSFEISGRAGDPIRTRRADCLRRGPRTRANTVQTPCKHRRCNYDANATHGLAIIPRISNEPPCLRFRASLTEFHFHSTFANFHFPSNTRIVTSRR